MKTFNNITLQYTETKRDSYMSLGDLAQDLTTQSLIEVLPTLKKLNDQMTVMGHIEKRDELTQDDFFQLLEKCNGI